MASPSISGDVDLLTLQDEFAKYLVIKREKSAVAKEKKSPFEKLADLKQRVKEKIDKHRAFVENLMPKELESLQSFLETVKVLRSKERPPPLKRPEALQLNLLGVALFAGNEAISRAIRYITKSSYSHVALLLHDATKDPSDPEGWYVYSANGSASQIMADRQLPQVQLEKWSETMDAYDGAVHTRHILFEPEALPTSAVVTDLVDKYIGLPYENQLLIMLRAMNRSNVEADGHASSAFCSEICYRFLAAAKVIEDTEVPENIWPKDFSIEGKRLKLAAANWAEQVMHKAMPEMKSGKILSNNDKVIGSSEIPVFLQPNGTLSLTMDIESDSFFDAVEDQNIEENRPSDASVVAEEQVPVLRFGHN